MPLSIRTLPQHGKQDFGIQFTVTPIPIGFDLTAITHATWVVTRPDQTTVTWSPVISSQTSSSMLVSYVFAADGSDLAQLGAYLVEVDYTTATGTDPGTSFSFTVVPANRWNAL